MVVARIDRPVGEMQGPVAAARFSASLLEICQAIGSSLELRAILDTILGLCMAEMRAQEGSILLLNENDDRLEMLAACGLPEEIISKGYIPRKGSIAEWVIEKDRPLILNESPKSERDTQGDHFEALDNRRQIVSSMCVPLRARGRVLGTVNLNRTDRNSQPFGEDNRDSMVIMAAQAAIAIENSRLHEANLKSERLAAIGQTVAGISHCIKNMLTGVRGGLSLMELAGQSRDWDLSDRGFDILRRNLDRLSSLVLDMLDYSKERTPMKMLTGLGEMFEEMRGSIDGEAKQKEIEIEIELAEDARKVQIDAQQIYRCMLNLVHNAMDATPTGGKVRIQTERSTSRAVLRRLNAPKAEAVIIIRIGDTGTGIDAENRTVIFEPFFSTKGSRGTGLGLACTRKVILEHGGAIELETSAPDPAVFAIYLPE